MPGFSKRLWTFSILFGTLPKPQYSKKVKMPLLLAYSPTKTNEPLLLLRRASIGMCDAGIRVLTACMLRELVGDNEGELQLFQQ